MHVMTYSQTTDQPKQRREEDLILINIIAKSMIGAFALFAVAGTANALPLPLQLGSLPPSGSPNITSTGGKFKYTLNGGMSYKGTGTFNLNGAPGGDTNIVNGRIKIQGGNLIIRGIDPLSDSRSVQTLVTATYDVSSFEWSFNSSGDDLFGMATTGNADNGTLCPLWDFCTTNETVYIFGEFGTSLNGLYNAGDFVASGERIKPSVATAVTTIPVPAAVWLFGTGLIGLAGVARRRKHS